MKLHPDVQALSDAMHELERFLRDQRQFHWADKVAQCVQSVDRSDAYGLRSFLTLFGGMGSLNDLVLWRADMTLSAENDRLQTLISAAWEIANRLNSEVR